MSQYEQVRQAKTLHRDALLGRANVVGVGVGYKVSRKSESSELSIVVLVRQKLPAFALSASAMIPKEVNGVRTDVIEIGEVRALNEFQSRHRPAPGGVSIGHFQVTAGTLGCAVRDRRTNRRMILSNNHVLANCNSARPGDPIIQPGPADGGEPGPDTIAVLERFVPLRFTSEPAACNMAQAYARLGNAMARMAGSRHRLQAMISQPSAINHVDCALARPLDGDDLLDRNLEIGPICGKTEAELGMPVCKSGRTTAFTTGVIQLMDISITVNYTGDRAATFEGQVLTSPMSQGGDSGALIVTSTGHQAVGLLFAGSLQATIFNPIQSVLDKLQIDLPGESPQAAPAAPHSLDNRQTAIERAQAVRQVHEMSLLAKANVIGVGIGLRHVGGQRTNQLGLVVLVTQKQPLEMLAPEDRIPSEIDGVPVDVKEVGQIDAY